MKRLLAAAAAVLLQVGIVFGQVGRISTGGNISPDGKAEVQADLPAAQRQHNIASSGLGCCVFRSLDHAARLQNEPALVHFPEWMVEQHIPGGGYPEKVDELIPRIAKDRSLPVPEYVQSTDKDANLLELALRTGRAPCVTFSGHDGVHYSHSIAHMVNLVYLDGTWACILDNNFVGENELVWMSRGEFLDRWSGWSVILLAPRWPAAPRNAR